MTMFFPYVACLQMEIQPGDTYANLRRFSNALAAEPFPEETLIVLPELWATGFAYPKITALAEQTPEILVLLQRKAAEHNIWFAGSLLERGGQGKPYNTLFLVGPEGAVGTYRKQHLFRLWQEDKYLRPGREPAPIESPFGPLGALVCYDLRFPEISRSQVFAGSQLILVSAQWPAARLDHWQLLVRARAVENQVFIAACNGCGRIGEAELAGHSMIVDPTGKVIVEAGQGTEVIHSGLQEDTLNAVRSRFCTGGERPWSVENRNKIFPLQSLRKILARIRKQKSKIVFTNGCFDLLHAGHVRYLEEARRHGDCLVVGLNSDSSVRMLKGDSRPVNCEQDRAEVLAALGCVDFITIFSEDTPRKLITDLQPDILVKGADWPENQIVGAAEIKAAGGKVQRIPFECQSSTTGIIEKIIARSPAE